MDLIGQLSSALGVDEKAATAVAGAVMGNVAAQAEESEVDGAGAKVREAVPELGGWLQTAKSYVADDEAGQADDGLLGGLMGAASSGIGQQLVGAIGGKDAQQAVLLGAVLQKAGLSAKHATLAAPLALEFLKSRVDPVWMERLLAAAPLLTGEPPAPAKAPEGGMMGALGGLFGS